MPSPKLMAATPLILYVVAVALGLLGVPLPGGSDSLGPLAQWLLALSLGLSSLWAAFGHILASEMVAESIGWKTSPFQHEVGAANLGIGLGSIAAAFLGAPAAWAILLMAASFLWGAAVVHVRDMVASRNFAINNAGPIFWWDIICPLTLLVALL